MFLLWEMSILVIILYGMGKRNGSSKTVYKNKSF